MFKDVWEPCQDGRCRFVRLVGSEIGYDNVSVASMMNGLEARVSELEKDRARLDWMQTNLQSVLPWACIGGEFGEIDWRDEGLRDAIDSAMQKGEE